MIRAARCALFFAIKLEMWGSHSGVAFGFVDAGRKDDVIVAVTSGRDEFQAEGNRIYDIGTINVGPIDVPPNYYNSLFVFCFDCLVRGERHESEYVPIRANDAGNEGDGVPRHRKILAIGNVLVEIFYRRPSTKLAGTSGSPIVKQDLECVINYFPRLILVDLINANKSDVCAGLLPNVRLRNISASSLPINEAVSYSRCDEQATSKYTDNAGPGNHFLRELFAYAVAFALSLGSGLWGLRHLMFSYKVRRSWPLWTTAALAGFVGAIISVKAMLP